MPAAQEMEDRVNETSTTTGTGDFTLSANGADYQTFNNAFGLNVRFPYSIEHPSTAWETGQGYLSAPTTLVRETVHDSSNAGALVSFAAGTKNVFCTPAAATLKRASTRGRIIAIAQGNFNP